jgi:ParB family protein of integrating conjugative element (PFGI_1 class)
MGDTAGQDLQGREAVVDETGAEAFITLPVDQIGAYDANPRHGENPEYGRIKASILAKGIDQPLIVTQRTGETTYMVHSGGNTRLQILHELYRETGDARFQQVTCVLRPWTEEVEVLLAHLRENDLRGPLTFLDKARAVHAARGLLESMQGGQPLEQKQLCRALHERGYKVSRALVCQMTYAVEQLLPLMPQALNAGMGRPQVERVRQLARVARAQWRDRLGDDSEFDATFATLCRRYDAPDWDIADLRRALEAEIAERADVSIHAVSLGLEQGLVGGFDDASATPAAALPDDARQPTPTPSPRVEASPDKEATVCEVGPNHDPTTPLPGSSDDGADAPASLPAGRQTGNEQTEAPSSSSAADDRPNDLKSLRARAWTLASRLAQRNGLSELIQPLSGHGLGFVLNDVPDPALVDQLDEDALAQVSMVWWHLAAAAEMTVAPVAQLLPTMEESSVLRRALHDQDAGLLFASVWTLDPGHTGFRLWRRLGERDWQDLLDLMSNYRAIYRTGQATGQALWP